MKYSILLLFLIFYSSTFSQKIKIKINDVKDSTVFLVRYYGKSMYYADTAIMKNGVMFFDGKKQKEGLLAVLLPGQRMFDFVYHGNDIDLETSASENNDFYKKMKVKKSFENEIFYNYVNHLSLQTKKFKTLSDTLKKIEKSTKLYDSISSELKDLNKNVIAFQKTFVETYPSTLISKIIKMSIEVELKESPKRPDGSLIDSSFTLRYALDHYFDNIDLNDDRLLNTPVFHNKLNAYFPEFFNYRYLGVDTIIKYAFRFMDRLNPKSEIYKYCLVHIASTYEKSNIMGMDKVFVKLGDRYYCQKNPDGSTNITWMDKDKLEDLCKKVNTNKNLVLGVVPPNISLVDTSDVKWRDFYSLKKDYIVLYFWDPECGHCKKTTPKLGELYSKKLKNRNVEVFAIGKAIGEDFEKWKKFIKENKLTFINVAVTEKLYTSALENPLQYVPKYTSLESLNYQETYDIYSTPRIFVLDKDKKIIAKSLSISQLEDMLDHLQDQKDVPKLFPPDPEEDEHAKTH